MKWLAQSFAALVRRRWFARHRDLFVRPATRRPRLFVDISEIARNDARTGIQRVVRAVWLELSRRQHPRYDFCPVYAGTRHGYLVARWPADAERPLLTSELVTAQPGDVFLGLDLAAHYLPRCAEQLAAWRAAGVVNHFVVYDLLPLVQPGWFNPRTRRHFQRWFATITREGDRLLCISEAVVTEVRALLGRCSRPTLGRIFLSGDLLSSRPSKGLSEAAASALRDILSRPTVLMVGTLEPRKGYAEALAAMEQLWAASQKAPSLLIVGKAGWKTEELQARIRRHAEHGSRLHWLDDATDEALAIAYSTAAMVLLATRSEGFGLPLVEASHYRKWILARDLPVFREQGLTNVRFFDDDAPPQLAAAINDVLALAASEQPPLQKLMTWADCVDRLLIDLDIDSGSSPSMKAMDKSLANAR